MANERERLLRAAGDLLGRTGFQDTSMADIAEFVGVPRSSLYYHFGGKSGLLTEILRSGSEDAYRQVVEIANYPLASVDKLKLVIRALILFSLQNPSSNVATVYHVDSPILSKEQRQTIVDLRDGIDGVVRGLIEACIEDGTVRPINVTVISNLILSAIGRFQSWYRSDGPLSTEESVAICTDFFMTGMLASNSREGKAADLPAAAEDNGATTSRGSGQTKRYAQ
jgi:AcrR family transcriptional regulator